jgi:hypothetical protein
MARNNARARSSGPVESFSGHRIGRIVAISEEGQASVDFPGNPSGPLAARSILDAAAPAIDDRATLVDAAVVLIFENEDPRLPIICGLVRDRLRPKPAVPTLTLDKKALRDVLVDGRQLVFEAQQQILLRCGKSSVLLRRDGKVVVRGTHLLSRSSGPNKIKGGSIDLN